MFNSYWMSIYMTGGIFGIQAWALGLFVRSGQLSGGHAALVGIGGYTAGYLALQGHGVVFTLIAAIVAGGLAGLFLGAVTLHLNHLFLALSTLIFGEILVILVTDSEHLGSTAGLGGIPLLGIGPLVLGTVIAILIFEFVILRGSRLELHFRLLAANPELVQLSGRNANMFRVLVLAASGAAAGYGGALMVYFNGGTQPTDLGFAASLNLLIFVIVGGSATGVGPLLAGFLLTVLPYLLGLEGVHAALLTGSILLFVIVLVPDGLIRRWPVRFSGQRKERRGQYNDKASA